MRSCFASTGTCTIHPVNGIMDSIKYQDILGKTVMPSVKNLKLGCDWTFQQDIEDNNPKHTSKSTKSWFQKKAWNVLEWPSQSPDLNPTENLCWDPKRAVHVHKHENISELEIFAEGMGEHTQTLVQEYQIRPCFMSAASYCSHRMLH